MEKQIKVRRVVIACVIIEVFFLLVGMTFLFFVDIYHTSFKGAFIAVLDKENRFSGEVWFSVMATIIGAVISAVPSLVCGLLAILQSQKLHDLENRYHRPMLELNELVTNFLKITSDNILLEKHKLTQRQIKNIFNLIEKNYLWYIEWKIRFKVKNEIAVTNMQIEKIKIKSANLDYLIEFKGSGNAEENLWELQWECDNGEVTYCFSCDIGSLKEKPNNDFWNAIEEFASYEYRQDEDYRYMEMVFFLNILYEFSGEQKIEKVLNIRLDVEHSVYKGNIIKNKSSNGYFTYGRKA